MLEPPVPENETARLHALDALGIMYTPAEERFDRITRLTCRVLGVQTALVSLVSEQCQWFKSAQGLDATETPRNVSFCGHAILSERTLVIEDAAADPRFADNPLVTGPPFIRFYAGHPVHASDGSRIGTLCAIDPAPRMFSDFDRQTLRDLAAFAEAELQREQFNAGQWKLLIANDELQRKASIDDLTRTWNRPAIADLLNAEVARATRGTPLAVAMIDVDHFKAVNDSLGHPAGDRVLAEIAGRIRGVAREFDAVGRYGGEEFLLVLGACDERLALLVGERIRRAVETAPIPTGKGGVSATVSVGIATYGPDYASADVLIEAADRAMYRAKAGGRNRVEIAVPA